VEHDLAAWLTRIYRARRALAMEAHAETPGPWKLRTHDSDTWLITDTNGNPVIYDEGAPGPQSSQLIIDGEPLLAAALAAAGLLVLKEHAHEMWVPPVWMVESLKKHPRPARIGCITCDRVPDGYGATEPSFEVNGWCQTVRILAAPFAHLPGYRSEWAPLLVDTKDMA